MGKLKFQISVSLDGFMAGPNQSEDDPLGVRGKELHEWAFELQAWREEHGMDGGEVNVSSEFNKLMMENVGAFIMGRNMFGGGHGPWNLEWEGWWGDDPPYHQPVYVLTHHEREPLEMEGGTTFHFVTDGYESALEQARAAAGDQDVSIGGGAETIRQYLSAGLVDEFQLTVAPVILGSGERPLDGLAEAGLKVEQVDSIAAEKVTHLSYVVSR